MRISELADWVGVATSTVRYDERVEQLTDDERTEIAERIARLGKVRAALHTAPPPPACRTDLSCGVPDAGSASHVLVDLVPTSSTR